MSDWRARAACAGADPTWWHDESPRIADAVEICGRCPVSAECLADARARGESATVRGGLACGGTIPLSLMAYGSSAERKQVLRAQKQAPHVDALGRRFRGTAPTGARLGTGMDIDPVAVDRWVMGDRDVPLNRGELIEAIHRLTELGYGAPTIAAQTGLQQRQVFRYRREPRQVAS